MNKILIGLLSIGMIILNIGCASSKGFNRGALLEQIGVKNPVVTEKEIKEILNRKPNLPKPFKLGVYFKKTELSRYSYKWRWNDKDKELILDATNELNSNNLVSEVIPISGSVVEGNDLKSIRVAAAKHGVDAVLVIDGAADIDNYTNKLGWTYIFLLTAAFVPGSEADTLFMSSASLWDVRNEFLYFTAEAEGVTTDTYVPIADESDEKRIEKAKNISLSNLKTEIVKMIKGIKK